jgi:ElaB/YqjD/DUF883 family membrane-anchored ribosome-binding protein
MMALILWAAVATPAATSTVPPEVSPAARRIFRVAVEAAEIAEMAMIQRDRARGEVAILRTELSDVGARLLEAEAASDQNLRAYREQADNVERLQAAELELARRVVQANERAERIKRRQRWFWVGIGGGVVAGLVAGVALAN